MQPETINEFSQVARCLINTHKSVVFLYASNKLSETKIKKIKEALLGSLVGFCLWGRTESDTTEVT